MGCDPVAKVFYGFVNPEDTEGEERTWGDAQEFKKDALCDIEIFGYDGFLRYAVAVRESVLRVEWSDSLEIDPKHFSYNKDWDIQLAEFVSRKGIDVRGLTPKWHLVSLYF